MISRVHPVALALLVLAGCTGDAINVGEQTSSPGALYPSSLECVPGEPFEPEVDWEGYVENSVVEIANQRVRIREPQGNEPGFVLFGSGPRLPEATDPNAGWPCADMSGDLVLPGHPYTIENPFFTESRMQFRIRAYEPMESWCALHAESAASPGVPGSPCDPPELVTDANGNMSPTPAAGLCHYCTCDSAGCRAKGEAEPLFAGRDGIYYLFDIAVDGDRADGTVRNLLPDISAPIGTHTDRARFERTD